MLPRSVGECAFLSRWQWYLSLALLLGLYLFVTYEQTAIPTVPAENIEAFVPVTQQRHDSLNRYPVEQVG